MSEFESVYREYAGIVFRYLRRLGCGEQDAQDITQETFVKALVHIDSFRGDCRLSVWLCRIAKNTWYTHLKKKKREPVWETPEGASDDRGFFLWMDLVDRLGEPYRGVFLKKALGGWEYAQLASFYGRSESWARVTYYRARLKLQEGARDDETEL